VHNPDDRIPFPKPDEAAEILADLRESPERREAREDLARVLEQAQKTLMRTDTLLVPAIDLFLKRPNATVWQHVLDMAKASLDEVNKGVEMALSYDARYGGLLGEVRQVRDTVSLVRDSELNYRITGGLAHAWQGRGSVLRDPPADPAVRQDVIAWRDRLMEAYGTVRSQLEALVDRLRPSA